MVQTIIPPPCCCEDCDDVFVPPTGCYEVFAPGQVPGTDLPIRWVILPYPTGYPYPDGSVVLACNQQPTIGLVKIQWVKKQSCGPYALVGFFGESYTEGPETYNDLRWFDSGGIGRIEDLDGGIWQIRQCQHPYYFGIPIEDGPSPACLTIVEDDETFSHEIGTHYGSGTDLCGQISSSFSVPDCGSLGFGDAVIKWEVDPTQRYITITYCAFFGTWSTTIPWVRNWWVGGLSLSGGDAEHGTTRTLNDCSTVDPDQCLADAAEGTISLDFTFTVDGTECSNWDAPLGPHTITAGTPWVYESDATHYISKMTLILDNLSPGIEARLKILYSGDLGNFSVNGIEYTGTVDGECIDGQFFGSVEFSGPICGSSSTAAVVTIDFVGPV